MKYTIDPLLFYQFCEMRELHSFAQNVSISFQATLHVITQKL